jgi:rubrerythrin
MAEEAREEGFHDIAAMFEGVGAVEKQHEARYRRLLEKVEKAYRERVFVHSRNKKFVLAKLGNDAGIMGAAALILADTNKA